MGIAGRGFADRIACSRTGRQGHRRSIAALVYSLAQTDSTEPLMRISRSPGKLVRNSTNASAVPCAPLSGHGRCPRPGPHSPRLLRNRLVYTASFTMNRHTPDAEDYPWATRGVNRGHGPPSMRHNTSPAQPRDRDDSAQPSEQAKTSQWPRPAPHASEAAQPWARNAPHTGGALRAHAENGRSIRPTGPKWSPPGAPDRAA